jgi:hypothetical protein
MYSGRHVVIIDFQLLVLKSDRKEGRILGTEVLNFNFFNFGNINNLLVIYIRLSDEEISSDEEIWSSLSECDVCVDEFITVCLKKIINK